MEGNFTAFSLYGTAVPLHPLRKTGGRTSPPGHRRGYQPVLVQLNVVLQELVGNNHVLADEFMEVLDAIADELTVIVAACKQYDVGLQI